MTRHTLTAVLTAVLIAVAATSAGAFGFRDVPTSHPHYEAVEWAVWEGYAHGYEDGSFRPDEPITRAQMAAMLHRYHHAQSPGERQPWRAQD